LRMKRNSNKKSENLQTSLLQTNIGIKPAEANQLFRGLFEQAPLGLLVIDPETAKVLEFNDVAHRQLGYSREEFAKLSISDYEAVEKIDNVHARIKDILLEGEAEFETRHKTKNGKIRNVLVNVKVIEVSGKKYLLNTYHDITKVKRLKTALTESEERFQGIANSVRDALVVIDDHAKVTYWNPAAEKTFGYTSDETIGKEIHELIVPKTLCKEGRSQMQVAMHAFIETGTGYFTTGSVQITGARKDNTEFPAQLSISPIKLGGKWNAVGVIKDMTALKQAEQKLREAEQRYHALFHQSPLGVLVVDPETKEFVEFNDMAPLQLGYSREEFEKITVYNIESRESKEQVDAHVKEMLMEGGCEFETQHQTKNGDIRNVLVTTRRVELAGKTFLHAIYHDITEIRKIQNALMESESRYRQLVELAQEGIWAFDKDFATVFVNPLMAQMLGYTQSEMIGKSIFEFVDKTEIEDAKKFLIQNKQEGIIGKFEYAFPKRGGTRVDTSISASRLKDDQGQQIGTLAVVTDITERKQAEKALKASEELSKAIVANAPIGIATSDPSYHFIGANEVFCKILGYTEEELRKITFKAITHPDDIQESVKKMVELESGATCSFVQEKRYIKRDGTTIIGQVTVSAIKNSNNKPLLFIIELEEITKRKQLENDLRASEERFRAISTSAMDAILLLDQEDQIIYWNPAAEKTFGYIENEVIGKKLADLIIPVRGRERHASLLKSLNSNLIRDKHFEYFALRKDRTAFPLDLSVTSVKLKDKNCLLAIIRDITERKAMEEALRQERDMLESMAANIGAGLTIIGTDYRILWANQVLTETHGHQNLEKSLCYTVFDKSGAICPGCGVKKIFETNAKVDRHDYHIKRGGNDDKWIELIATPVKNKEGKVIAALELAVDVTERKRLQTKLAEYSQQLEEIVEKRTEELKKTQAELVKSERLAAIGELAGMVGHDLRNPLTGIKNSAYFLKKKGKDIAPEQGREMLETIDKCVNYSNKIVSDLLDYSREVNLDLTEQSPRKLINESLSMMRISKKIKVHITLDESLVFSVDSDKIKRVFINLIKNAVDAMPNGGALTIDGKKVDGYLEISFSDTGVGISEETLPKLFSPLFTTKAQGMGFGLAICKRLIEAHGGSIIVKAFKDKETTFTVKLPVERKFGVGGENVWVNVPEYSLLTTMKP
jgi:PAS domain S-box-containing protein